MNDGRGRQVSYLRLSLTDRCSLRCTYCMPAEGIALVAHADILSYEEAERVVRVLVGLGVRRVRLTGGEPTLRRGVVGCVARLAAIPGLDEVVMTSNGERLVELAGPLRRAGLASLNVSLDSLVPERFASITRGGDLGRVLAGLDAARAAGLPVKTNTVALKGWNDDEIGAILAFAHARGVVPRFIELMPMSGGTLFAPGAFLGEREICALAEAALAEPLAPEERAPGHVGPARYRRTPSGRRLGVIAAVSERFCSSCNRVRVSAVGALHTCLARDDATDLRALLRGGASDADLAASIRAALQAKPEGHGFSCRGDGAPEKHMAGIGG
jgi:GTP 3',8-cyclase